MTIKVGSSEARTHLIQLLERVARGEKFLITRHGKPIAHLVPASEESPKGVKQIIKEFKKYSKRQGRTLGPLSVRKMIVEGRRF